jgi:DNA polymerase III epsilon subunit family exonuclease
MKVKRRHSFQKLHAPITMTLSMQFPVNLISDSPLVQDTFDFLSARGGRASMAEIVEGVLQLSQAGNELSKAVICDLLRNDPRFIVEDSSVSISMDDDQLRPLDKLDFVVLDVEAVANRPARIIELAACRVRGGEVSDEFQTLVNPGVPLSSFIAQLTGLSDDLLSAAPPFEDVISEWLKFAGDGVLVAHNSDFDILLLNQEIARVFPGRRMRNSELCTVKLARRLVRNSANHNLDALAFHFGFEIPDRHRAASDARATVRVLLHLLAELQNFGVNTLAEARNFRAPTSAPATQAQLALDI